MTTNDEQWRPIPGFDGYEASRSGRVRSLRRPVPRVLLSTVGPCGFATVGMSTDAGRVCRRVGTLVASAWLGPAPAELPEVRRLDGNTLNDTLANLAYGTRDDVVADHRARAARERSAGAPDQCPAGHDYADSWLGSWGGRHCPTCHLAKIKASPRRNELKRESFARRHARDAQRQDREVARSQLETVREATCEDCGLQMTVTGPGPLPRRCPGCKHDAARAADRRHYRSKRAANA